MSEVKVIMRKQDRIDYILNGLCQYYDITKEELLRRARTDKRYKRKRIAVKILRDIADCSFKDIKYAFNNTSENTIWFIHHYISEDLESNLSVNMAIKKEYADVLKSMGL